VIGCERLEVKNHLEGDEVSEAWMMPQERALGVHDGQNVSVRVARCEVYAMIRRDVMK
jgi:hypothetical protein